MSSSLMPDERLCRVCQKPLKEHNFEQQKECAEKIKERESDSQ